MNFKLLVLQIQMELKEMALQRAVPLLSTRCI